ncbi:unnamed protein product [Didymodactylos carnosus]|uniref:RCC1-like domain-containing protein n=1 Tax=Didymodactylos carnosus TaxID=1234261 RepID=A0A813W255_9BILA|nr:unnamed protein product [Didymodactylos carnosus]CAF3637354.1 unnamed protein product [Didymodactylos carnosus]
MQNETSTLHLFPSSILEDDVKHPVSATVPILSIAPLSIAKGGDVLAVGENGMGQMGMSSNIAERQNAQPVPKIPEKIVQIVTGPLHSVLLTEQKNVYSFGCNDEKALGHTANDDDDSDDEDKAYFGRVDFSKVITDKNEQIIQVAAGDSHTIVLTNLGKVYGWGTFRSSTNGPFGLIKKNRIESDPVEIHVPEKIIKIASGHDFALFLSETGQVYSCGNGETGQLGRLNRYTCEYGGRAGTERLIQPSLIQYNRNGLYEKDLMFEDIFASSHGFFLKVFKENHILAGGLNNFHQLGFESTEPVYFPAIVPSLEGHQWKKFAGGLHHTLALTNDGQVYAFGRHYEGQLGHENLDKHLVKPKLIENIPEEVCDISCGNHVSFILAKSGKVYSFGDGTSLQHGHGHQDIKIPKLISSKYMDIKQIQMIAVGSQHTLFLAADTAASH